MLLLGIVSFAAWKLSGFGWKIVELWRKDREEIERHSREFGDRVASAVEAQVSIGERHAAIVDAVGETLNAMQSSQETQTEAFMIALDALKEPDDKIRHMLIDQARQKLS